MFLRTLGMWFVPGDGDGGEGGDDGVPVGPADGVDPDGRGSTWSLAKVIVLAAACSFLAAAATYFVMSVPDRPAEDSVDVGFLRDMVAHHGSAIDLALGGAEFAQDSKVRRYARDVIVWQRYEMGMMDRLLGEWGYRGHLSPDEPAMAWMGMPTTVSAMPGMPTEDTVDAVSAQRTTESDRLFLEAMIEHHRGGVHMAEYARDHAATKTVRSWAEAMVEEQNEELVTFRAAQQRLGFTAT